MQTVQYRSKHCEHVCEPVVFNEKNSMEMESHSLEARIFIFFRIEREYLNRINPSERPIRARE